MKLEDLLGSGVVDAAFFDEMYAKYKANPGSVDSSWKEIFESLDKDKKVSPVAPPTVTTQDTKEQHYRIEHLIQAYRMYGHLGAHINPLQEPPPEPLELNLSTLGFRLPELTQPFPTLGLLEEEYAPLEKIIETLKSIYCSKIGIEYVGVENPEIEKWLEAHIEPSRFRMPFTIEQKQQLLQQLNKSELFEAFLHTKYVGQKRFSLEGGETFIPILQTVIDKGAELGIDEFYIGMAHRGRLNVLCNIMNKSYIDIFSEFEDNYIPDLGEGTGDVKYHKGFTAEILTSAGHRVNIILSPNASHLESVYPIVEGQVRARQFIKEDQERAIPIIVHGDAAISGQGVVYETLQLMKLPGYQTGGTVHLVINNQIGFTTLPSEGRSTLYCTDIAHAFGCPVFHVNAEDPEGCVFVTNLALELRHRFHIDVFIDMLCYRKYGHNEGDEPAFTQPLEYQLIRNKKSIRELYKESLISQGVLEKFMAEQLEGEFKNGLQSALKLAKDLSGKPQKNPILTSKNGEDPFLPVDTGVPLATLQNLARHFCTIPADFNLHPKLEHLMKERLAMAGCGGEPKPVDWGMAETLAYATLLVEGVHIRLSGQDSTRGTFSHRHAIWVDQKVEGRYSPLSHLSKDQGRFEIYNSPLSEYAVMGFDYGYSSGYPEALVIWEAQYGDFANVGQADFDQYIATAEQKWGRKSSLVLFLPHGYEGQGPDHSSARIERCLTVAANENMVIANPSTPAQFFHLLRRHKVRPIRKPMIVFTPKALLRHPDCTNPIEDFTRGGFQEILDDTADPSQVRRIVFCTGQIYYDLLASRSRSKATDMALVRVEQLYPFYNARIKEIVQKYKKADAFFWVQPEPANMGAWVYIEPLINEQLPKGKTLTYIGRERSAATAVGTYALHKKQHAAILEALFPVKDEPEIDVTSMQRV